MKIKQLVSLLLIGILFMSCSSTDKVITGRKFQKRKYTKGVFVKKKESKTQKQLNENYVLAETKIDNCNKLKNLEILDKEDYDNTLLASSDNKIIIPKMIVPPDTIKKKKPDILILRTGEEKETKVKEINIDNIKYLDYNNLDGPLYTIPKNEIFMIKYSNGNKDVFSLKKEGPLDKKADTVAQSNAVNGVKTVEGKGVAGFILGLLGYLIGWYVSAYVGLALAGLGFILSIVSLSTIAQNPDTKKGRGFGIWGLLLSITIMLAAVVFLK